MADVVWTMPDGVRAYATVIGPLTGAECTGAVTKSVGPCGSVEPFGLAVAFDETGGGISQVVLTAFVILAHASTAFALQGPTGTAWSVTITATSNVFVPIGLSGATSGSLYVPLRGIQELQIVATFTGTGQTTDAFSLVVVGRRT